MQAFTFVSVLLLSWGAIRYQKQVSLHSKFTVVILLLCYGIAMQASNAQAKKVYSPIVEQGEVELEYSLDYSVDTDPAKNTNARHQFELEYGATNHWMTAVYGDFKKNPGQTFTYQGFKWENIYQLFEQGTAQRFYL